MNYNTFTSCCQSLHKLLQFDNLNTWAKQPAGENTISGAEFLSIYVKQTLTESVANKSQIKLKNGHRDRSFTQNC